MSAEARNKASLSVRGRLFRLRWGHLRASGSSASIAGSCWCGPKPLLTSEKEFYVISNLMIDAGAALDSIANTLPDGIVEENELNATIPKLEAVIRECASVKYLLEQEQKEEGEEVARDAGRPLVVQKRGLGNEAMHWRRSDLYRTVRKGKIENPGPIRVR